MSFMFKTGKKVESGNCENVWEENDTQYTAVRSSEVQEQGEGTDEEQSESVTIQSIKRYKHSESS